ncbi:alkaline shock response membrane anchor protein AmaP [Leuconostoc citreum]
MKKWQKWLFVLIGLVYLFGIAIMTWPKVDEKVINLIKNYFSAVTVELENVVYLTGISLLIITAFGILIILVIPVEKKNLRIINSKQGKVYLSNQGINNFIKTQLSGEGFTNIKVNLKSTKRRQMFYISADALYKQYVIKNLSTLTSDLTTNLEELLSGVNHKNIKVRFRINKQSGKNNTKSTRVV